MQNELDHDDTVDAGPITYGEFLAEQRQEAQNWGREFDRLCHETRKHKGRRGNFSP